MKKLIALLLALVMVLALVACGGQTDAPAADAPAADAPAADAPAADAPAADEEAKEEAPLAPGEYAAFDEFPHPNVKPEGGLKIGVMGPSLTSESLYRWDWQMQVECAHRGWEYVSLLYNTDDNYLPVRSEPGLRRSDPDERCFLSPVG